MKKRLLSLFFALVLVIGMIPTAAALEGEAVRSADTLHALGLIQCDSSAYDLTASSSRAQATVLLLRLAGVPQTAAASTPSAGFADIPVWAAAEIHYAVQQGWITGVTAAEFRPYEPIACNIWFSMLLRMLGYSDAAGDFTVGSASDFARRIGLTSRGHAGNMSLGDLFESMREALTFQYKDGSGTVLDRLLSQGSCSRESAAALGLLSKSLTARQAADRLMSAVFCLEVYSSQRDIDMGDPTGQASGFFITSDGIAVTNYHSIDGGLQADAVLVTGERFPIERVLYYDTDIDIAVIRVSRTSTEGSATSAFSALKVAGTKDIRAGDIVYALSNPLGLGLAISSGIISAVGHEVKRYALPCIVNSADISQGSSGGALLNEYGHVIGVTSGAYTYGNNMYLAVPVDPVLSVGLSGEGQTLAEVAKYEKAKAEAEEKALAAEQEAAQAQESDLGGEEDE